MNNFQKAWLTATCAPESIEAISFIPKGTRLTLTQVGRDIWVDKVYNEDRTKYVKVLSHDEKVICIINTDGRWKLNIMSYNEACVHIANIFSLSHITT